MKYRKIIILMLVALLGNNLFALNLSYDINVIPTEEGIGTQNSLLLNWNQDYSSRINFRNSNKETLYLSIENYGENSIQVDSNTNIHIDILPIEKDLEINLKNFKATYSFGINYINIKEKQNAVIDDINGFLDSPSGQIVSFHNERDASLISPRAGLILQYTPLEKIKINYTGFLSPIYYITLSQNINYSFLTNSCNNSIKRWSSPYFEYSLNIQYDNWIRAAFYHTYQRLDFQTMDWNIAGDSLVGVDDIQIIQSLRMGIEVILGKKIGLSGLKFGVYLKHDAWKSSYWKTNQNTNKITFAFGTQNF